MKKYLIAATVAAALPTAAQADTIVFDVTGAESFAAFGDPANNVFSLNIGANSRVTGLDFDVNVTAFDPSWLSELRLAYTDSGITDGVFFTPGFADANPGTMSYAGSTDLVGLDLDFMVGADGILRLEFFEGFNDAGLAPDGIWNSGTITFTFDPVAGVVPEPATWAFMIFGFGAVGGAMRGRRKTSLNVSYS